MIVSDNLYVFVTYNVIEVYICYESSIMECIMVSNSVIGPLKPNLS